MSNNEPDEENLRKLLSRLDQDATKGLESLIKNNPELLEGFLADLGYLDESQGQIVGNKEASSLTDAQRGLNDILQDMGNPRTAEEIVELIKAEYPSFIEEYQSSKHRSWVHTQLNELVEAGEFGRFKDGRTVRYTPEPTEAIRHWALHNNRFVEDVERKDAQEIANDTGMPLRVVIQALENI